MEIHTKTEMFSDDIFDSVNRLGNKCRIETGSEEERASMTPVEILLSALSSCVAVDLNAFLKKRKKTILNLKVEAKGNRAVSHPRRFTQIHLVFFIDSPDVNQKEFEKYASLAMDYCSVGQSLSSNITWQCVLNG